MPPTAPLEDRLWPRIDADGPCWIWTGARQREGYGVIKVGPGAGTARVHRLVWQLLVGPIPPGLSLDHLCRVRACCNPDHLEPVTQLVNTTRGTRGAGKPRATSCPRGHEFTPDNTKKNARQRTCRACANERNRIYRANRKAA